jgi:DNA-binding SARP family transcriptional activator
VSDACPVEQLRNAPDSAPQRAIRVLGPLLIHDGDRDIGPRDLGGVRPKQVLEILLAARGHRVPVDRLIDHLWGEQPPRNAAGSLQTFVSVLRRRLSPDRELARRLVATEPEAYRFATGLILFDLDRFDELLEQSGRQPTRAARTSLETALDLVRGEAFEDEPYAAWAADLRGSYQGRILGARLDAAELALAERDLSGALAQSEAAAALDRFSERAQRSEMLALYALGRGSEALDRYRAFRRRLDDELGLGPGDEARSLESAILRRHDVQSLLPRRSLETEAREPSVATRLLGRDEELEQLVSSTRAVLDGPLALLHVESEPGVGKTRLLDELRRELRGVRIGSASASALESHLPHVPLATALREALTDRERLGRRLPALGGILPELRLGSTDDDIPEVAALEALVAALVEQAPLVLVIDDLQWADARTIAALGYLRRRGADLRVAIVTAASSMETVAAAHPLRGLDFDVHLRLEPLTSAALAPLGVPGLHERTGGHPRFVQEELTAPDRDAPSSTLADALVNQCRAEGPFGFRVLAAASIMAQPFEPEPIASLLGADPIALTEELERLCTRRLLRVERSGFRFRYDLVRQAVHDSISPARRRLMQQRMQRGDLDLPALRRSAWAQGA